MADQVTDARRMPFRILYDRVIDEWGAHIGPDGLAVYWALARFANSSTGDAWPSAATIGKKVGMSRRKAVDVLHLLADWGLIQITPRQEQGQKSNLYTVLDLDGVQPVHIPYAQRAYPPMQDMHPPYAPGASERDISNKSHKNESAPASLAIVPAPPDPFDAIPSAGDKLRARETECPADFAVTDAMQTWARQQAPGLVSQIPILTRLFVSHYRDGKGAGTRSRDWTGMWRNWMIRELRLSAPSGTGAGRAGVQNGRPYRVLNGGRVAG